MTSNISSVPFSLLLLVFLLPLCFTFHSFPTVLGYSVPFFSVNFLSEFQLRRFCWHILKLRESFLRCVHKYHKSIKDILHSCYSVSISVWFFLRISISLFTLPSYACVLSNFSIRDLSILIIVILLINCFSDNSNFLAIFASDPDACSAS